MTTVESILKLSAGKELDAAVHEFVFGLTEGAPLKYSANTNLLRTITDASLPLSVGRMADNDPSFTKERPYFAEDTRPIVSRGQKRIRVVAATPEVALCKAACILSRHRKDDATEKQTEKQNDETPKGN
jgi:hypothetical protein